MKTNKNKEVLTETLTEDNNVEDNQTIAIETLKKELEALKATPKPKQEIKVRGNEEEIKHLNNSLKELKESVEINNLKNEIKTYQEKLDNMGGEEEITLSNGEEKEDFSNYVIDEFKEKEGK